MAKWQKAVCVYVQEFIARSYARSRVPFISLFVYRSLAG